ncbi:hypothetical protein BSKO_06934 [Bryopsis sp. KO-2023]|nr:hypothetical protein BSKO_06934 [Bryopsis sp. KO-2023]
MRDVAWRLVINFTAYVVPAYKCFKALERRNVKFVRFWCEYWLVISVFAVSEVVLDILGGWFPLYNSLKLLFIVYLWHPKTEGATPIYVRTLRPFLVRYQGLVDKTFDDVFEFAKEHFKSHVQRIQGTLANMVDATVQQQQTGSRTNRAR